MKEMPSAAATFVYEDDEHEKFINCPARAPSVKLPDKEEKKLHAEAAILHE
ncbi:hypothetical protein Dimus_015736 [Dionaea muscipula]